MADGVAEDVNLEEVLKMEAEALVTELDQAVEDGLDPNMIQELEDSVENAAEALITMKEARTRLNEVKRDRGYGRAPSDNSSSKASSKKTSGKHACFDCGLHGHWAGDPECQKLGQGLGRKSATPKRGRSR